VNEVALNDQLAGRMLRKPPFGSCKELVHFVFAHPVMFVVVENRDEHIELIEKCAQALTA
jgi:hypothetical protein